MASSQATDRPLLRLDANTAMFVRAAAGVVSLQHAVRELVENALDANATVIEVTVNAPRFSLSVWDNGTGISRANLDLVGVRNATSKCRSLRDLETAYHEKLIAAGSELLERVATDRADSIPEEARALLGDKDTAMGVINAAHDARVARLDAKEDELRTLEDSSNKRVIKTAVESEYQRNRTRVIEIWKLCHEKHRAELDLDRFED